MIGIHERLELFLDRRLSLVSSNNITSLSEMLLPSQWREILVKPDRIGIAVDRMWRPHWRGSHEFLESFGSRITELAIIQDRDSQYVIGLVYVFMVKTPNGVIKSCWLGGLPAPAFEDAAPEQHRELTIPQVYRAFASLHNGFWVEGNRAFGVRQHTDLRPLSAYVTRAQVDEYGLDYAPDSLLAFLDDGSGNMRCIVQNRTTSESDGATLFWDHDSLALTDPRGFWVALAGFIASVMKL